MQKFAAKTLASFGLMIPQDCVEVLVRYVTQAAGVTADVTADATDITNTAMLAALSLRSTPIAPSHLARITDVLLSAASESATPRFAEVLLNFVFIQHSQIGGFLSTKVLSLLFEQMHATSHDGERWCEALRVLYLQTWPTRLRHEGGLLKTLMEQAQLPQAPYDEPCESERRAMQALCDLRSWKRRLLVALVCACKSLSVDVLYGIRECMFHAVPANITVAIKRKGRDEQTRDNVTFELSHSPLCHGWQFFIETDVMQEVYPDPVEAYMKSDRRDRRWGRISLACYDRSMYYTE